jgi:hypothetical protein
MIRVDVAIDSPATLLDTDAFGAAAVVRLERAATETGVYAEIDTAVLVATTYLYTFWDAAGVETSWYRWRVSNAANDEQSGYSDPFQGDDVGDDALPDAYVSLSEVIGSYNQALDSKRKAQLRDAIGDATSEIDDLVGFDFFRHPQTGTETFTVEANGHGRLCVHDGIVPGSVTKIEVRGTVFDTWTELELVDWVLEDPEKPGHPSFHLRLSGLGSWARFPCGVALVRITGARGWPAVPRSVRRAARDKARQLMAWDATRPGGASGPEELGASVGPNRMPDSMFRLRYDYSAMELGLAQCEL